MGREPCSTPCALSSLCCAVAQADPSQGVSRSLACCPLHLLKSSPGLLTARLRSRLLQELPPQFLAARRLYVGCKGEVDVGKV